MKHSGFHRTIVAIAMMLIGWLPSLAHDFEVNGIFYDKLNSSEVAVTYKGDYYYSYSDEYSGNVVIPSSVNYNGTTYSVTSIGYGAFFNCKSLTSIEIPNSVTSIGSDAFNRCESLTSIEIPNSVTWIGIYAFYRCSSLTSIEIPNSVTWIGEWAFTDCSSLTSIEIPNSVTSIEYNAFSGCSSLTSIEIPYNVTWIGNYAFNGCSSLTSIEIPNSVTSIGDSAFNGCSSLTSIVVNAGNSIYDSRNGCNAIIETASNTLVAGCQNTIIPNSVTSIGSSAFYKCSNLTGIEIPNSVTSIGDYAFYECSSLTSIEIPNGVTSIGKSAFKGCSSLTSVEIPNSVTSIGDYAFVGCESLTSIAVDADNTKYDSRNGCNAIIETASNTLIAGCQNTIIPNSVTSIGKSAFSGCSSLTSIEIPNSVTWIGIYAFSSCESLASIEIPNGVTSIGDYAFYGCSNLTSVVWNAIKCSDFYSYDIPFENCPNITSFTFGDEVEHIPAYLCYNLSSLTSIQIPNSVTRIGDDAFSGCTSLTSIEIPNSVTRIRYSAFYGCSSLTSVVWNAIRCSDFYFDYTPFENCPNITSFTFGDEVEHIPAYLCYNLSSLTSIQIPNSVTSIGNSAFYECDSLTSVVIGNSVTSIGDDAFYYCSSLTSIEIPNSVTSIGSSAFEDCESLTSVVIGNSVTRIRYSAFYGCSSLTSVVWNAIKCSDFYSNDIPFENCPNIISFTFGDEVEYIPEYLCYNLSKLTSIEIGNSVTSIGNSAFEGCDSLTSVVWNVKKCSDFTSSENRPFFDSENITSFTFGDSVEHIPAYLCYGMSGLTNLEIPNSTTSIGESAFYNGEKLTILVLGNSVILIEKDAFKGCDNIKKIDSKATKAPTIENEDQFSENVYAKADLFVPTGYEDNYKYAYAWSEFYNIKGKDFTVKATSISLNKNEVSLKPTQTVVLTETIQPYDTSNKKVTWSSSDDNIAKVDTNGLVTSIAVGEATITATTTDGSNLSASCKVIVVPTLAESITLDKTEISLEATETATLVATILPELATDKSVKWSSSNEAIAVVDENGVVTAVAVGEATITATTADGSNLSASCKVTVVPSLAQSITLDKTEVSLKATETTTLVATVLPENATNKSVTWKSSNEVVAIVDANGKVTAVAVGEATITATTTDGSNKSATCKITVAKTLAESITLDKTTATLKASETLTLKATIAPATTTDKSVTWKSSNEAVATVDTNGLVTAVAVGEAIITATTADGSNKSATCKVTVTSTLATSITLDYSEYEMAEKSDFQLIATILPELTTNKGVVWSSSDMWIASVDENGLVRAYSVGEAVITATTIDGSNLSASCKVTVVSSLAQYITLDKTEVSLEVTETAALVATVLPELTTDKSVKWSSSNESVTVVDNNGVVTAISIGEAVITATTVDGSNLSASCKVTVIPTLAVSIELDQTEASVEEKSEFQLTATILPEHATNKEVAWSSSKKVIATVDETGLVFVKSVGEVVITATTTDGTNLSATCRINVYSGIDGVEGDDLIVATIGDNIVVKNAKIDSIVRVYAADGSIISSEVATDGDVVVEAPIKGVYIVSVNGKTFKVMVK